MLLSKVEDSGDKQEGTVGEPLLQPIKVQVLTMRDQPAAGRRVAFVITSAAGDVSPDTAVTDTKGEATARWELGTSPGVYEIEARLVTGDDQLQSAEFSAVAKPAPPDTLSAWSTVSQPGRRGQKIDEAPVVRVVDRFGNPVPDIPVVWQVISGEGRVSEAITRTGFEGITTTEWTLGDRMGVHKLTATVEQATVLPATFTAAVLF